RRCDRGICEKSSSMLSAPIASSISSFTAGTELAMYGCAVVLTWPPNSRSDWEDDAVVRPDPDAAEARELAVELGVARVDEEPRRVECGQLLDRGDEHEGVDAGEPDPLGAQLLVSPSEDVALATDDGDEDPAAPPGEQLEELRLAEIAAGEASVVHRVDPERRPVDPEPREDPLRRRA